jgi:hypothetical protein
MTRPFKRVELKQPPYYRFMTYDIETTNIAIGTPELRYITLYGEYFHTDSNVARVHRVERELSSLDDLCEVLEKDFLKPEFDGYSFVAWNGNRYDGYFVAHALLQCNRYIIVPYLTRSKQLRGLRVTQHPSIVADGCKPCEWQFLDGIAMTVGAATMPLKKFLAVFAPEWGKLEGVVDFEGRGFNARSKKHREYAMRDSEGLYHAMRKANDIIAEHFHINLKPTIGATAIRIFQSHLPDGVEIYPVAEGVKRELRASLLRGGFCYLHRQYKGPVWKYDINQAYCAAMRECHLPCGDIYRSREWDDEKGHAAVYRVKCRHTKAAVPYYFKDMQGVSVFSDTASPECWLTGDEVRQLRGEGWRIEILDGLHWEESFVMNGFVALLEHLRRSGEGGTAGAQGMMMKAVGNNAYGKTVEELEDIEYVFSLDSPGKEWMQVETLDIDNPYIWQRDGVKQTNKPYHVLQVGAFITAHVRMKLREAIMQCPEGFIYADTDSVVFDRPVDLDIDPSRYGAWKIEAEGEPHVFIAKKVYASLDGEIIKAKGMNSHALAVVDMLRWMDGSPPVRTQLQRNSFMRTLAGDPMFRQIRKRGAVL